MPKNTSKPKQRSPDYKQVTYPQLRSFCEVARLGTMAAAAEALEVAQPTVWKQIRALEKSLGVSLVESNPRGCTLTTEGRLLLELSGPAVNEIENLPLRFEEATGNARRTLVVAVTPRLCAEDLPECAIEFEKEFPRARLVFREVSDRQLIQLVESGAADIAMADISWTNVREELDYTDCYSIEPILVVASDNPLATKRQIKLADMAKFPLLNARDSFPDPTINAALNQVRAYDHPDRRVELVFANTIQKYVQLGFGIGLAGRVAGQKRSPIRGIVERSLSHLFKSIPIHAVYRKRIAPDPVCTAFIDVLKTHLGTKP